MRYINLNHAKPFSSPRWLHRGLLLLGLLSMVCVLFSLQKVDVRTQLLEDDIGLIQHPQNVFQGLSKAELQERNEKIKLVNVVTKEWLLPWEALFEMLEKNSRQDVRLLSIEPDAKQGKLRLVAETSEVNSMMTYVETLSHESILREVFVSSHELVDSQPNGLRFVIEAIWKTQS